MPSEEEAELSEGKVIYERYCQLCHGPEGAGYAADHANQLSNPLYLAVARPGVIRWAIERGRPGTPMAAFSSELGGPLDDKAIKLLVKYVRSLVYRDVEDVSVTGDPHLGQSTYRQHCATCHGENGEGKSALSLNNPYFLATASNGYIQYAIRFGRPGTAMAPFEGKLASSEIGNVTLYIRSWTRTFDDTPVAGEALPAASNIVLNPEGAPPRFRPLREGRYVPADELRVALNAKSRLILLDARPTSDWLKSHIPGAYPAPFYNGIQPIVDALPRDGTWIVCYCACPHAASGKLVDLLRAAGFKNTAVLDEGMLEWSRRRYQTTFGRSDALREVPDASGAKSGG